MKDRARTVVSLLFQSKKAIKTKILSTLGFLVLIVSI